MATALSFNGILNNSSSYIGQTFNKLDNMTNEFKPLGKLQSIDGNSVVFDGIYYRLMSNNENGQGFFSNKMGQKQIRSKILPAIRIENDEEYLKKQPLFYPVEQQVEYVDQPSYDQQYNDQPYNYQNTGGKRKSNKNQENGGSVLGTLAAPGVLLVANEIYKRKTPRNKTPKRGGSIISKLAAPGVLFVANEIYKRKTPRNKTVKRGGSVLAKLAAPGVLMVANELYKRKSSRTFKNKSRKFSKTRKYGRK
jgi:hypothetical protein